MVHGWTTHQWDHLTNLKNMADCQEWKGQIFQKIYVRKITQHEEKFFQLSFKGMIRPDLNMEHDEVYGKFVLTVCICSILYFCKKIADCKKTNSASLFTRGTRNTCMQQHLALVSKQPYFPNMKYLKIVVIFTLSIFLQKKCENNEKIMSFNYKIYNLHSFFS